MICPDEYLSPYAASKKAAETLCYTYHHAYQLDVTILRYFTVYGPGGRPDMAIDRFIAWTAEETPLILYGDGTQERDFTYVDDIAQGTVLALQPMGFEVINLGSDRPVTIRRVIQLIEENVGKSPCIVSRPAHPADVPATWADITKAKHLMGFKAQVKVEDGLIQVAREIAAHPELY